MPAGDPLLGSYVNGNVLVLTLQRSEAMNARNLAMRHALIDAIDEAEHEENIRAIVLTGSGRAFSVGFDMVEAAARADLSIGEAQDARLLANDVSRVAAAAKPTIAAINGYALGGGLELALACDIRLASDDAVVGMPEVSRGTLPGNGGTQRLPRLIGIGPAMEVILTGDQFTAAQAERLGIVNRTFPPESLISEAVALAARIAANGPLAVRFARQAIRATQNVALDRGLELESALSILMLGSEDRREGIAAFREKRPPVWRNK